MSASNTHFSNTADQPNSLSTSSITIAGYARLRLGNHRLNLHQFNLQSNFEGKYHMLRFLKIVHKAGMYVHLWAIFCSSDLQETRELSC
ncbi:hypothetical protein QVD17_18379 [Tagetes erecta]|uniref:Uncharacterized protein n=1 Tax=Tagetes erecta TaxID=13708 RepID=A0AAD8KNY8_TARER|nr:hypothetical protein QVD17_18379 [Tagetes erecta]